MYIEITFLRIKSEILVFFQEETWHEKRVSEAFNAIQSQILNKLVVSQKSDTVFCFVFVCLFVFKWFVR